MDKRQLQSELQAEGVSAAEAHELLELAAQLSTVKTRPAARPIWSRLGRLWPYALTGLIGALLTLILMSVSSAALPGQPLYAVKRATEAVRNVAYPPARVDAMIERSREVARLAEGNAPAARTLSALNEYNRATEQIDLEANYSAWEYCSSQLKDAAASAPEPVKQAIAESLARLKPKNE